MRKLVGIVLLSTAICAIAVAQPVFDYVNAPDDTYTWEEISTRTLGAGTKLTELQLTSQVWQGITWTHRMQIITPAKMQYPQAAVLFIIGGTVGKQELPVVGLLAHRISAPVVILGDIPNQPLFEGRTEDHLIAFTFSKYLETGDRTWPLLYPMTKAAVRAMDAVEEYTAEAWETPVTSFYVTGASKRGWTTWFTAEVAPERIVGIAPMVYDNLNLLAQMRHHLEAWGHFSGRINEYTELNLPQQLVTSDAGKRFGAMVDPYTYRAQATMPKLIIAGTNDPYWPLDAANLYFADLPRPRYLWYASNAGHGLGDGLGDVMRVINVQVGFFAACTGRAPLPDLEWNYEAGRHLKLFVSSDIIVPKHVYQWTALSPTRDFRPATWHKSEVREHNGRYIAQLRYPEEGYAAIYAEAVYDFQGVGFGLCTNVRIVKAR